MKSLILVFFLQGMSLIGIAQGRNSTWLLGYNTGLNEMSRFVFDTTAYSYTQETRKMQFYGTEATISDEQGNFLMSSNGVWIANANNDTMMNGGGLNPSYLSNTNSDGIPLSFGNVILPYPGDSTKFYLFHMTSWGPFAVSLKAVYKSIIDITLDGGLGMVIEKNDTLLSDTLSWGITACKHANGRDWWVVVVRDGNPTVYTLLVTPYGVSGITSQTLGSSSNTFGNVSPITFSQNGERFAYCSPLNQSQNGQIFLADFDRCSGSFSNIQVIPVSSFDYIFGMSFSASGNALYCCSSANIYQISTTSLLIDTVAIYDGFISGLPPNCCATDFWSMYLAADGKIYITSGSSVQHHHVINYPDSAGVACDVQQHAIPLNVWSLRAVPNHPNYYLGAADGTVCDSLGLNPVNEPQVLENTFKVKPNPNNGQFSVLYILPQGESGLLEVYDLEGKQVYRQTLPPWSTLQTPDLLHLQNGVYQAMITSGGRRASRKVVIVK